MARTFTSEELAKLVEWSHRQRESDLDDVIPMTAAQQRILAQPDPDAFGCLSIFNISGDYVDPWITVDRILAGER